MSSLLRHFQLQPHGRDLLTPSAEFWLFSARAIITVMAVTEMLAWGYLGSLFGEGQARWFSAAFVGGAVFVVVWMIDASLVTLDRAWREHAIALGHQKALSKERAVPLWLTLGLRVALLFGSLYITSPYLAQIVFVRDIQRINDTEATSNLENVRTSIAERYKAQLSDVVIALQQREEKLNLEVAGKGLSGVPGRGAATKALEDQVAELRKDVAALQQKRDAELAALDALTGDWQTNRDRLQANYNVQLPRASVSQNSKALDVLRQRPENQATELAIKAFLAFIFVGLLLLKMFEPSSVRLYMSDVLQQEYQRYKTGVYDDYLPPGERSDKGITAQALYDFIASVWVPRSTRAIQDAEAQARARSTQRSVKELEAVYAASIAELDDARRRRDSITAREADARQSLTGLRAAIDVVNGDITRATNHLKRMLDGDSSNMSTETRLERTEIKEGLRKKLAEANAALEKLIENVPIEEEKAARALSELQHAEQTVRNRQQYVNNLSKQINDLRISATAQAFANPQNAATTHRE